MHVQRVIEGRSTISMLRRLSPRHGVVLACFLAAACIYIERVGFSIAYTRMAKEAAIDEGVKGQLLSTFYWGYALSQARR